MSFLDQVRREPEVQELRQYQREMREVSFGNIFLNYLKINASFSEAD